MPTTSITVRRGMGDGLYTYYVAEAYPPGQVDKVFLWRTLEGYLDHHDGATDVKKIGVFVLAASVVAARVTTTWAGEVPCYDLSGEHGEGYQVVGYDAASKTWTILRTETLDGASLVKRIIVGCRTHKYGDGETLQGRDFCSLVVGRLYAWKSCDNGDIEMVDENFKTGPPTFVITQGRGWDTQFNHNYEVQVFDILRYEALPDRNVKSSPAAPNKK